jgi:GxxExxY protein
VRRSWRIMERTHAFADASGRIIGCALEVHKELGRFFMETTYQKSLAYELQAAGLEFSRECWVDVYYKGKKVDKRRVDFIIEDILVETKAKEELDDTDFMQTLSYLKASGFRLGLLLNFGSERLEIKRLVFDPDQEHSASRKRQFD